ncbi:hypothetical protein BDL97_18G035800 [Sphagnum fallax]|nr:hypothetical protein BDL97_18G035800 [Sphagnum fallax]
MWVAYGGMMGTWDGYVGCWGVGMWYMGWGCGTWDGYVGWDVGWDVDWDVGWEVGWEVDWDVGWDVDRDVDWVFLASLLFKASTFQTATYYN